MAHDHDHHDHHDHEHRHDHLETAEFEWGLVELEAHVHDQAATVSMNVQPQGERSITFSDLVGAMCSIARAAESAGGVVGHIKAFARQGGESARASVTAPELAPTVEGDPALLLGTGATIQLVAIVLLIGKEDLLAICKGALIF